jgi:aspartate-semialdehyde dehydrogenase
MLRSSPTGYRIVVVNPLTLVGREVHAVLRERHVPASTIDLVSTMHSDEAALTALEDEAVVVLPPSREAFAGVDIVFFCGPTEANLPWVEQLDGETIAIDLSQPSALADAPAAVAGVNELKIGDEARGIVSPHPVAIPLIVVLDAIAREHEIEFCTASVIQPASEFEQAGVDELLQQTIRTLNMQSIPRKVFDRQLAFNLYPAPGAAATEPYVAGQIREVLGGRFPLSISITQGTIFNGHSISLFVRLAGEVTEAQMREALDRRGLIDLAAAGKTFSTIDSGGRDEILIGRVSKDMEFERGWWIWIVADNLRRASAVNAVAIAEELISQQSGGAQ